MLKSVTTTKSVGASEPVSSFKASTSTKKNKNKYKKNRAAVTKNQLEISCYKELSTRKVIANKNADKSINSFLARTTIKSNSFEDETCQNSLFKVSFPRKKSKHHTISPELDKAYEKLSQLYINIKDFFDNKLDSSEHNDNIIQEFIIDLISVKQEIIIIWNKYNPGIPYKYNGKLETREMILEDKMLDCIQVQLYTCYSNINDDTNKLIIINQLIEQKSKVCFGLFNSMFIKNITDYNNLNNFNFKDMLITYNTLERFYKKNSKSDLDYTNNQIDVIASVVKLCIDKSNIDYLKLINDKKLTCIFLSFAVKFVCFYQGNVCYEKHMQHLSLGLDLYYDSIEDPLFKGIHDILLTEDGIAFAGKFSSLIKKLSQETINDEQGKKKLHKDQKKLEIHNKIYTQAIEYIQQQIKQLLFNYNIDTTDISSWYNTFIEQSFREIFSTVSVTCTINLAKWVDVSIQFKDIPQENIEIKDNIKKWLDILAKDYKLLVNDTLEWKSIPVIILSIFSDHLLGNAIRFAFGTPELFKNETLAILHAKINQACYPFLGTTLLAIANKDNYDELLAILDMLELISQQPKDKSQYIENSKYLTAQIITYLLEKDHRLELNKKQFLFNKAEKLYQELAISGIDRAYLFLAETTASLAKTKMYSENFLEAASLYDVASGYCKTLSKVNSIDVELQDLAIINMHCFSTEAETLRKINEEQKVLIQELTAPTSKATAKSKKKSFKKITDITKNSEQQELAKEITTDEVANWHQAYKYNKEKTKQVATKLPKGGEITSRNDFWKITKELQMSSFNLEASYGFLEKIIQNTYFKLLEAQFKNGITGKNSWIVLLVYQKMAYYHFLQLKYAKEIGNNNIKLFYTTKEDAKGSSKTGKINFVNISSEAEHIIRQVIELVCPDTINSKTINLRELVLSLSPNDYGKTLYKNKLAATISTYGHLTSLDDIDQGRKSNERLAAILYDKADEINPKRVIKKLTKKAS